MAMNALGLCSRDVPARLARLRPVVLLVLVPWLAGCAARQELSGTDLLNPPARASYYVTTKDGQEMEFISLRAESDTLTGTMKTIRRRMVGSGELERVEVQNQYREMAFPLSDVRRVEIEGSRRKSLLYMIAGAVVAGGTYFVVNRPENDSAGSGGGGKTPPQLP